MLCTQRLSLRTVLIFCSLLLTGFGKLVIHRIDSPVEALLGHNTIIPCHFSGYKASHLDLSTVSVHWTLRTLEEELVYLFNGGHRIQNRSGSDIPERGLEVGDASLHIPNLQLSDEGEYTCCVIVTPDKAISKVTVQLSAKPTCIVSNSSLVMNPDTERSVTCYVSGFHPAGVRIHWLRYSKTSSNASNLDINSFSKTPIQNSNGTYDVRSVLSVTPLSIGEDGDVYSCVIVHRSLTDALTCNVTLSVQPAPADMTYIIWIILGIFVELISVVLVFIYRIYYKKVPPQVLDIIERELIHMETTQLACPIVNFRPKNISIALYLNKDRDKIRVDKWDSGRPENKDIPLLQSSYLKLKPSIPPCENHLFSCACAISITPHLDEHNGAKLILEVQHEALKEPVCKQLTLRVKVTGTVRIGRYKLFLAEFKRQTKRPANQKSTRVFFLHAPTSWTNGTSWGTCTQVYFLTPLLLQAYNSQHALIATAAPVLDPIEAKQESYNVGDHLELSCKIHSFHPQYINVIWYKEEGTLPSTNHEVQKDGDGLFYMTSSMRCTVLDEDFGKMFRCKVQHPGTRDTDEGVTWRLGKQECY